MPRSKPKIERALILDEITVRDFYGEREGEVIRGDGETYATIEAHPYLYQGKTIRGGEVLWLVNRRAARAINPLGSQALDEDGVPLSPDTLDGIVESGDVRAAAEGAATRFDWKKGVLWACAGGGGGLLLGILFATIFFNVSNNDTIEAYQQALNVTSQLTNALGNDGQTATPADNTMVIP